MESLEDATATTNLDVQADAQVETAPVVIPETENVEAELMTWVSEKHASEPQARKPESNATKDAAHEKDELVDWVSNSINKIIADHDVTEGTKEAVQHAHQKEKPKSHTHTKILLDGTKVITYKRRKSLPDGSLFTKSRKEKIAATSDSNVATTHVIKTHTKRINSGDGLSFSTTTKEEMKENPPIVYTRVLSDGSRVIKSKMCTVGPVTTTTTVHLTNIPVPSHQNVESAEGEKLKGQAEPRDVLSVEISEDDNDVPVPPQYAFKAALEEYDEEEAAAKKIRLEVLPDEEPPSLNTFSDQLEVLPDEEPPSLNTVTSEKAKDNASEGMWASYRKIFRSKNAVAPLPVDLDDGNIAQREPGVVPGSPPGEDDESLAVARPVQPEEDGPIYPAEKYIPSVVRPYFKRKRYVIGAVVALLVIRYVARSLCVHCSFPSPF